jgi:ATP-dependent DNA helicase DinG
MRVISFAKQPNGLEADTLLGEQGIAARLWPRFELRPQQLAMAQRVQQAFREQFHLAVEAGTGVGKSFAYLAGAFDIALRKAGRVVISTYTLNLQQQLIQKDIPFLQTLLEEGVVVCLAKGRGHYLCKRRLEYAKHRQQSLFDDSGVELIAIADWAARTKDGSLSDLPELPSAQVWQAVQSEHGNCKGRKCAHFAQCFYWRARRQLEAADIIVANHALLFSDLALKSEGAGVLPEYEYVVLDEAHTIEHVAEEHFGIHISQYTITSLLDRLYHVRRRRGLLAWLTNADQARQCVRRCRTAQQVFFAQVQAWFAHAGEETGGRCEPGFVEDTLSDALKELRLSLVQLVKSLKDEEDKFELVRSIDQLAQAEKDLSDFLQQTRDDCVYWVEAENGKYKRITLRAAPLDVAPYLRERLFGAYKSVVLTSATLSCGKGDKEGFAFFAERIGLDHFEALQVGSPFDYRRQMVMYIEADMPDPNAPDFIEKAAAAIQKYLLKSQGRAFVLFTSYAMMQQTVERLKDWLDEHEMNLLVQGAGLDRDRMLSRFKQDGRCVLFGTDSFWQGVDVPGEALSNVIIVRLPFAVPSHPLIQGRIERMRQKGQNPFMEYQLPMAIIKFKQGFGRLIRSKSDTGMVVVLDSRIVKKHYGRQFLAAIPECRVERVSADPFEWL